MWARGVLAGIAGLFIMTAGATEPAKKNPPRATRPVAPPPAQPLVVEPGAIDSVLKGMVDTRQIIGVSALVYRGDQEVYFGAYGFADRENNKPMTRDTIVQIFSMTKPITGVA